MHPRESSSIDSGDIRTSAELPFLHSNEKTVPAHLHKYSTRSSRSFRPYIFHILAFVSYSIAYFIALSYLRRHAHLYTPVDPTIRYENVYFNGSLDATNEFKGDPRPELDEAWGNLSEHINLRFSQDELQKMNRTSVELYDQSGYFGMISAYHHLHCLKYIRQYIYNDHYNLSEVNQEMHLDHCIDDIRQALMCNADLSVITFRWRPDWRHPWPNFEVDRTCIDWQGLDDWAAQRSFDILDQKSLVHPEFGISYPIINGERENLAQGPGMHIVWPDGHA